MTAQDRPKMAPRWPKMAQDITKTWTRPGGMREAIRRPARDGVLDRWIQVLPSLSKVNFPKPRFSESERLSYPSLILPRRPAHSARPTFWLRRFRVLAPLGRKNGIPRGLQKLIKF